MAALSPLDRIKRTENLIASLETSLIRLREDAEDWREQIAVGEDLDLPTAKKEILKADGLIATLQKMEAKLVDYQEKQTGRITGNGAELDLDAARFEVGCRLARLKTCC